MRLMVKLENFKKFLPGDTRRDVTLKDVYNKVEMASWNWWGCIRISIGEL